MKRAPVDYGISLLLVPVICITMTITIRQDVETAATRLGNELDPADYEVLQSAISLLLTVGTSVLLASILLPALFALLMGRLGNDRDALARTFAPLVRTYLAGVAAVMAAQGCLVFVTTYEMVVFGVISGGLLLIVLGALGLGMLAAAVAMLADIRRMVERAPVQVTGVPIDAQTWPSLHRRIESIAARLKVPAPGHVVISLAPQTFATAGAIRLRGERELAEGVTLCVSAPELRVLGECELDATLAAALGVLCGESLGVSRKLIPSYRSLVDCVAFFERDDSDQNRWFKYARIPAQGFLTAMLSSSSAAMRKVAAARSGTSQGTAVEVSSAEAWAASLIKASILHERWNRFRSAYELYMLRGQTRANLSADFVAHVARFAQRASSAELDSLAGVRIPHPFDVSPTLAEQMGAHAIDASSLIRDTLADLVEPKAPDAMLASVEARITSLENDYFHVPGRRAALDQGASTPAELLAAGESAA
jgi:hypothetical protein